MRLKQTAIAAAFAFAAFALGACGPGGEQASTGASGAGAPGAAAEGPPANAPAWVRQQWKTLPEWTHVANVSSGGVILYNPRSIRRDKAAGAAEVLIQVVHKEPLLYRSEDATTVTETWYFKEIARYQYKCAERTFTVSERTVLGDKDQKLGAIPASGEWRDVQSSGPAIVLEGPVCKAV